MQSGGHCGAASLVAPDNRSSGRSTTAPVPKGQHARGIAGGAGQVCRRPGAMTGRCAYPSDLLQMPLAMPSIQLCPEKDAGSLVRFSFSPVRVCHRSCLCETQVVFCVYLVGCPALAKCQTGRSSAERRRRSVGKLAAAGEGLLPAPRDWSSQESPSTLALCQACSAHVV